MKLRVLMFCMHSHVFFRCGWHQLSAQWIRSIPLTESSARISQRKSENEMNSLVMYAVTSALPSNISHRPLHSPPPPPLLLHFHLSSDQRPRLKNRTVCKYLYTMNLHLVTTKQIGIISSRKFAIKPLVYLVIWGRQVRKLMNEIAKEIN